jgi:hypothetical protein
LWSSLPASAYPVVVDPTYVIGAPPSDMTHFDSTSPSGPVSCSCGVAVGSYPSPYWRTAAFFNDSPISSIFGTYVSSASIQLSDLSGSAPTSNPIYVYADQDKPITFAGVVYKSAIAQENGGTSVNFTSSTLTSTYQNWVANSTTPEWVGFVGTEASGDNDYENYLDYQLSLTYYHYPGAATGLSATPCSDDCAAPPFVNSATPTLTAQATDSDGLTLDYNWTLQTSTGSAVATGTAKGSAAGVSWQPPTLTSGTEYRYQVQACVDAQTNVCGTVSSWYDFTVDLYGAPTNVVAYPGNGQAEVTWTTTSWSGSPGIAEYEIAAQNPNNTSQTYWATVSCDQSWPTWCNSGVVTGLPNGTALDFFVWPVGSLWSAYGFDATTVTPTANPTPYPPQAAAAFAGNGDAWVRWNQAPADAGTSISLYYVDAFVDSNGQLSFVGDQSVSPSSAACAQPAAPGAADSPGSCALLYPSLSNGTSYVFYVYSYNGVTYNGVTYANTSNGGIAGSVASPLKPTATPAPFPVNNLGVTPGSASSLTQWAANPAGVASTAYTVEAFPYNNDYPT